jgi:hypothetical protein
MKVHAVKRPTALHCRLIREFEKEARADDMRPSEIVARKTELTEQLNEFADMKKQHAATAQSRAALFGAKSTAADDPKHSRYDSEMLTAALSPHMFLYSKKMQLL